MLIRFLLQLRVTLQLNSESNDKAVNNYISVTRKFNEIVFEVSEVEDAVALLHNIPALDSFGLSNFHLKYAYSAVCSCLQLFFNKMIEYGEVPSSFRERIITPVDYNMFRPLHYVNNYRLVSISLFLVRPKFSNNLANWFGCMFASHLTVNGE